MAWLTMFDSFCFSNAAFFFLIRSLIILFSQGESLSSHKIILFGIKLWKIFNIARLNQITGLPGFLSKNRLT